MSCHIDSWGKNAQNSHDIRTCMLTKSVIHFSPLLINPYTTAWLVLCSHELHTVSTLASVIFKETNESCCILSFHLLSCDCHDFIVTLSWCEDRKTLAPVLLTSAQEVFTARLESKERRSLLRSSLESVGLQSR